MFFYSFDFAFIVNVPIPVIDSVAKGSGFIVVSFRNKVESAFLFWVWMSVKTNVLHDDGLHFYPCFGHRWLGRNQNVPPFRFGLLVDIGVVLPLLLYLNSLMAIDDFSERFRSFPFLSSGG